MCHRQGVRAPRPRSGPVEPIDGAHERFVALAADVAEYINSVETEADTRFKIIDRILTDVLGWPHGEVSSEPKTETGYADYVCSVHSRSRLVIEAKKDGRPLGVQGARAGGFFKLDGSVFRDQAAKEGIGQAIQYCGSKNAELACVTNGREWIVFRGNRLGDGLDTRAGLAVIFPNLVEVEVHFKLFYNLLSYESAGNFAYRPYFQEAEGQPIRSTVFHKSYRTPGSEVFLRSDSLGSDIERVMASFFQQLTGDDDPSLLELCFVETTESHHADTQLAKIATDILGKINPVDTGTGAALTDLIDRVQATRRHEFVLIVGTKGAGKSTFIERFFHSVLPDDVARHCLVVKVDMRTSTGALDTIVSWLDRELLNATERALFEGGPNFDQLTGMFYDEYTRLKGPWRSIYDSDIEAFRDRFGQHIETLRNEQPNEYIQGLIRYIVNSRRELPVIVFDNADHFDIEFQQRVYQYARSVYEKALCLVILPITDRTSWQLSKHGALQSFEHESLYLPTPRTDQIIRRRIDFIERRIEAVKERPEDRYFLQRGISLSIADLTAFTRSLQRVFLQTAGISRWIGDLANHDVRRTLTLARTFVTSPNLRVVDLLKAHIAGNAMEVPSWRTAKALIRGHYDIYPSGRHDFVQNVYALNADLDTTPLLGIRILQLLGDVPERDHEGAVILVDEVVAYCTGMNIENRAVLLWLDAMLKTGLILNYDPTVDSISDATQIEISPSGRQHLYWATGNHEYLSAMADVTPLLTEGTFQEMRDHGHERQWRSRTAVFLNYLLIEDLAYCQVPAHDAYAGQERLRSELDASAQRLSELATQNEGPRPSRPARRSIAPRSEPPKKQGGRRRP